MRPHMKLSWSRPARIVRRTAVAVASLWVVAAIVAYATAPTGEAIAAKAFSRTVPHGTEAINGRVLQGGKPALGTVVRVALRQGTKCTGQCETVEIVQVGSQGRFQVPVDHGRYVVVVRGPGATKGVRVQVSADHSVFVSVTVEHADGAPVIAPVVFNY